jgi:hypothetical protein
MSKLKTLIIGILVVIIMLMIGKSIRGDEGGIAVQSLMDTGVKGALAVPYAYNNHEPLPEGTFNVQIQALEVTQGVRGNIPSRDPSADNLTLSPDGAFHVADRRTVVRAYPRMITGANAKVPPLTAQLWVYRDGVLLSGSPVSPVNVLLENISPDRELKELRGDASLSWNFLLPSAWTASNSEHQSFPLRFVVVVNPSGLDHKNECQGCTYDNEIILEGQTFVHVPPIKIKPYLVDHNFTNVEGKELYYPTPTVVDLYNALDSVHQLLPIGDGEKGIVVLEPEFITFNGPVKANGKHLFAEAMIQQYLPGRSIEPTQDGVFHIFLFSPSYGHRHQVSSLFEEATTGLSWIGGSYVQAGARGSELAHELAHAIGMDHAGSKHGEATYDPDYPDDHGRVEPNAYGFDVWSMQAVPPDFDNDGIHDLMSYGRFRSQWVSIYTWKTIAQLLGQPNI